MAINWNSEVTGIINQSYKPLVIYGLGGDNTHTHIYPRDGKFKKTGTRQTVASR